MDRPHCHRYPTYLHVYIGRYPLLISDWCIPSVVCCRMVWTVERIQTDSTSPIIKKNPWYRGVVPQIAETDSKITLGQSPRGWVCCGPESRFLNSTIMLICPNQPLDDRENQSVIRASRGRGLVQNTHFQLQLPPLEPVVERAGKC